MENLQIKLVMVGSEHSGKTTAVLAYTSKSYPEDYTPTVFDCYSKQIIVNNTPVLAGLWDTAGQQDYDRLRPLSYPQTDVFVLCYSVDRRDAFESITSKWIPELQKHRPDTPRLLMALKTDLRSTKDNCITKQEGETLARENNLEYMEASAYKNENLDECFQKAICMGLQYATAQKHLPAGNDGSDKDNKNETSNPDLNLNM